MSGSYSSSINSETSSIRNSRRAAKEHSVSASAAKALSFDSSSGEDDDLLSRSDTSTPVFGPTTRRQWMEQVAKPPAPKPGPSRQTSYDKENDEVQSETISSKSLMVTKDNDEATASKKPKISSRRSSNASSSGGRAEKEPRPPNRNRLNTTQKKKAAKRSAKAKTSAAAMDTLDFFHKQTRISTQEAGISDYTSSEPFNDKSMSQHLSRTAFSRQQPSYASNFNPLAVKGPPTSQQHPPPPPTDFPAPPALQKLLDSYKHQMLTFMHYMQSPQYREQLQRDIVAEQDRNTTLKARVSYLEKQMSNLQNESMMQLKLRLGELGIHANTPAEFLAKAKEIVMRHKDLQSQATSLQNTIAHLESEQHKMITVHQQRFLEQAVKMKNGAVDPMQWTQEYLLKEVASSLDKKRKLEDKLHNLENEVTVLTSPKSDKSSPKKSSPGGATSKAPEGLSGTNVSPGSAGRGKGQSTRGKRGGSRGRNRKDSSQSQESSETLDARIKSIITNALMFDDSSGHEANKKSKQTKSSGKKDKKEDRTVLGNPSMSLPVRLPMVQPDPTSMPMSLPLSALDREAKLMNMLSQNPPAKPPNQYHNRKESSAGRRSKKDTGMSSSSVRRESYSPISRPSSSSSTASAESVKHLEHGARVASVSPKSTTGPHTQPGDKQLHHLPGSGPKPLVSPKGLLSVQTESGKAGAATDPAVSASNTAAGIFPGYPQIGAMLLGGYMYNPQIPATDKELYAKMLLSGSYPYGVGVPNAHLGPMMYGHLNGISKLPPSAEESKGRGGKARRRRSISKTVGGGGGGSESKKMGSVAVNLDVCSAGPRGSARREGDAPPLSRATPEVVSMMSTASQPLAISAISDAESTKSSPLDKSPTKNLQVQNRQKDPASSDPSAVKESPTSTKWNAQLSSGFESLLVFASTELDRSKRKSTDDSATLYKSSHKKHLELDTVKEGDSTHRGSPKVTGSSEMAARKCERDSPAPTKHPSRSSSTESRSSRGSKRHCDLSRSATSESLSPPRHRSRSPSPRPRDNNDDKYYEKLFKKKFFGMKAPQRDEQSSKYTHGSQFRPKGKDWKKNMPVKEGMEKAMLEGKEMVAQGAGAETVVSSGKSTSEVGKSSESGGSQGPVKRKVGTPPSRPQSSSSHSSAFQPTPSSGPGRETASPHSRSRNSLHTPSPTAGLQRPPSAGLPGISPLSTTPLSRSSPGGPPSRPGSDHFPLPGHSPFVRAGHPPLAGPLMAGLIPGMSAARFPDLTVEAARFAALGFDAARMPFFDLRGHPGFNLMAGMRPPMLGDMGAARMVGENRAEGPRHSFGGEPQMFNPLARHGKDPLWSD